MEVGMNHDKHESRNNFEWYKVGLWGSLAIIGYFLLTEHRAHVISFLPYLLLLACPLMHMFMHGGHGGHSHHSSNRDQSSHQHNDSNKKGWN